MHAHGQSFRNHGRTGATALRGAARINLDTHRTGTFRLVLCVADQLVPRCIRNAFRQTAVLDHPGDAQVFKHDCAERGNQAAAQLVGKILAPVGDALVDTSHDPLVIGAAWRSSGSGTHDARSTSWTSPARCSGGLLRR